MMNLTNWRRKNEWQELMRTAKENHILASDCAAKYLTAVDGEMQKYFRAYYSLASTDAASLYAQARRLRGDLRFHEDH